MPFLQKYGPVLGKERVRSKACVEDKMCLIRPLKEESISLSSLNIVKTTFSFHKVPDYISRLMIKDELVSRSEVITSCYNT